MSKDEKFVSKYDKQLELLGKVLDKSDYYPIRDDETGEWSLGLGQVGCTKVAAEMELTDRIVDEKCIERPDDNYLRYEVTVEILDKSGRVLTQEVGTADNKERGKEKFSAHNLRGFAKTRGWERGVKRAARIPDRVASDLRPDERTVLDELSRAEASAKAKAKALTQQADAPPEPEHAGPECECEVGNMAEPVKDGDAYHCGTCRQPLSRAKRIEFLKASANAA